MRTDLTMGLDILIFDDSIPEELRTAEHSEITDISFASDEWATFFFEELAVPSPPAADNDNRAEYFRKEKEMFISALSDFPMLSRIDDYYDDAEYSSREVPKLLKECEAVLPRLTRPPALVFANGLIAGCKKAIEANFGLILVAD